MPVQPYFMPQRSTTTPLFASFLNGFMQRRTATNMMFLQKYLEGADTKFLNEHIKVLEENKREYIKQRELNKRQSAQNRQKSVAKIVDYQAKTNKQNAEMRDASISRQQDLAERILAGRVFETTQGRGSAAKAAEQIDTQLLTRLNPKQLKAIITEPLKLHTVADMTNKMLETGFTEKFANEQGITLTVANKPYYTAKIMEEALKADSGILASSGALVAAAQIAGVSEEDMRAAIKKKDSKAAIKLFSDAANNFAGAGDLRTNVMEKRREMVAELAEDLPSDENFAKAMKDYQGTSGKLTSLQEKTARIDKAIAEDMLRVEQGQAPKLPGVAAYSEAEIQNAAQIPVKDKDVRSEELYEYYRAVLQQTPNGTKREKEMSVHFDTLIKYDKNKKINLDDAYQYMLDNKDDIFEDFNISPVQFKTQKALDKKATRAKLAQFKQQNIKTKKTEIAPLQEAAARKAVRAEALKPVEKAPQLTPKEVRAIKYSGSISNKNLTQQIKDTQSRINQLQGQRFRLVKEHQKRGREAGYFGPFKKNYLLDNPFVRVGDKERDLDRFLSSVSVRQTMPSTPTLSKKYGNLQMGKAYQITTKAGGTYTGGVTRSDKPFIEKISGGNVYRQEFKKSDAMYKDLENELKRFNKIMQARLK